jgi:hypothetical protein
VLLVYIAHNFICLLLSDVTFISKSDFRSPATIKCDLSAELVTYTKGIADGRQNSDNTESVVYTLCLSLSLCNLPL